MDPDRFRRIGDVFEEARVLATSERGRFLDDVCGDDAELRSQIEELLDSHESETDYLNADTAGTSSPCPCRPN